jgi:cell division protein FtsQ
MQQTWLKISLVMLLAGLLVAWTLLMMKPEQNATMSYKITTPLQKITLDDIEDLIWPYLAQGFWEVELVGLQRSLQAEPWIERAQVSRLWPNQLVLQLDEREPIARWGDLGLIDRHGVVFVPDNISGFEHLVKLQAHDLQARAMLRHWHQIQDILSVMDWRVIDLTWFADDVLRIEVDEGHQLYVIASDKGLLLRRFINAWPKLDVTALASSHSNRLNTKQPAKWKIDLRYSNGMALNPLNNVD